MIEQWPIPQIDERRCNRCGRCIAVCPTHAVGWAGQRPVILRPGDCAFCGICEDQCPTGAVSLVYELGSASSCSPQQEGA